jgi:prepilin-type N-terminal cleavage/methylation domain-containing protein
MRRQGFTIIELIFSIIILAIIGAIGAEIIANVYTRYAASRDMERAQSDLRRTLDIIAARLSYRVKNSVVARDIDLAIADPDSIKPAYQPQAGGTWNLRNYEALQWVGIAYESWRGQSLPPVADNRPVFPGWSAIAMRITGSDATVNPNTFESPLSNLARVALPMERTLTGVGLLGNPFTDHTVLVFAGRDWRGETPAGTGTDVESSHISWGWGAPPDHSVKSYFQITLLDDQNFTAEPIDPTVAAAGYADHPPSFSGANNTPNYYLVRSAYTLWTENGDLTLAYNFRPWLGDTYETLASGDDTPKQILLRDVTSFLFQESGDVFRLRLCVKASDWVAMANNDDNATQFCRERSVL